MGFLVRPGGFVVNAGTTKFCLNPGPEGRL
jgi:hypothetical protein